MRFAQFDKTISGLAKGLSASGSERHGEFLQTVLDEARAAKFSTDTALFDHLAQLKSRSQFFSRHQISSLINELEEWMPFIEATAKVAHARSIHELLSQLRPFSLMSLSDFIKDLRESLATDGGQTEDGQQPKSVEEFVSALRAAKHDPATFPQVFEHLKRTLNKEETVEVASQFAFKMAKSTTKTKALSRIWDIHAASRSMGMKIEAQDGKSAA